MINEILPILTPKIAAFRRDIHAHPELAFNEKRTAEKVAAFLDGLGLEVATPDAGRSTRQGTAVDSLTRRTFG